MQLGQHAGRLGPGPIGQPDPAQRSGARRDRHRGAGRLLGLTELGVKLGATHPGLVDVAMTSQVIFDRVDLPECSQSGDRRVIVGDGHVQSQAARVRGRWPCPARALPGLPAPPRSAGRAIRRPDRARKRPRRRPADRVSVCRSCRKRWPAAGRSLPGTLPRGSSTPPRAAAASPQTTATGVAITSAHGQAMTSTTRPRPNHSRQTPASTAPGRPRPWPIAAEPA